MLEKSPGENVAWLALQVRPRFEKSVAAILAVKGTSVYVPHYLELRRWSDRVKPTHAPLFPGYVFCHIRDAERASVLTSANAIQFVGAGRRPTPIDDEEMQAIRLIARSGLPKKPWNELKKGDRIRMCRGPLSGLEGTLETTPEGLRLVVSLTLLNRSIAVQVDREWVACENESSVMSAVENAGLSRSKFRMREAV
jgi:transcription antitermination factor NusG